MTYPTPCAIKGCIRYVNLAEPLPNNMRFVCPQCEDEIVSGLVRRMEAAGVIVEGNAEWFIQNVKMFRYRMRRKLTPITEGLVL